MLAELVSEISLPMVLREYVCLNTLKGDKAGETWSPLENPISKLKKLFESILFKTIPMLCSMWEVSSTVNLLVNVTYGVNLI